MRPVILITPPAVQLNTPYPATPFLTGFLRQQGFQTAQHDLSLMLALRIFSRPGLEAVFTALKNRRPANIPNHFIQNRQAYLDAIDPVIRFLQSNAPTFPAPIPRGPRFAFLRELKRARVTAQIDDRLLCSLMVDDLADLVSLLDPRFGLARYAEHLALAAPDFSPLYQAAQNPPGLLDRWLLEEVDTILPPAPADVIITIPFPGCLYGALRIARRIKEKSPQSRIIFGGGYVNTELRDLTDPRLFEFCDFLCYDDGEAPLLRILRGEPLLRTRTATQAPLFTHGERRHRHLPAPDYADLPLDRYLRMAESVNPMHRLWSARRWNKLMLAHGCYWGKCAFCDTSLDYIRRYDPAPPRHILAHMDSLAAATGENGFHFVDEAAPPALLSRLADLLIAGRRPYQWWTNIRFDPAFTAELCQKLARAGCIAVTGGAECPSPAVLARMNKGVTQEQIRAVAAAFSDAGVLVHAYLMHGFPGSTRRQLLDGLDFVRTLFRDGFLHSAFWHTFALTAHSPLYAQASGHGIKLLPEPAPPRRFARNEVPWSSESRPEPPDTHARLTAATYNYMHGIGLDDPVGVWFS